MFLLLQPCIPKYRVPFYIEIERKHQSLLHVSAAMKDQGGLKSTAKKTDGFSFDYNLRDNTFLFGKLSWQTGLSLKDLSCYEGYIVTGNPRYISNLFLWFYAKFTNKKIYWYGQGWSANTTKFSYFIRLLMMKCFDGTILYTETECKQMFNSRLKPKKMTFLNNGLDFDYIQECKMIRLKESHDIQSNNDTLNLLFIGRLNEKSKVDFILNSLSHYENRVVLNIIGDGDLFPLLENIELPSNIIVNFLGAIYDEIDIATQMNRADYFIYGGAVGLSLIHAFSYGVPAIIHNEVTMHMPEVSAFREGVNGLFFTNSNMESLCQTLDKAIEFKKSGYSKKMGKNAESLVKAEFNVGFMANQMIEFLNGKKI